MHRKSVRVRVSFKMVYLVLCLEEFVVDTNKEIVLRIFLASASSPGMLSERADEARVAAE